MANQSNYPEKISTLNNVRPSRLTSFDDGVLLNERPKQVLFGTDERDYVEFWLYNADGSFASTMKIPVADPSISAMTILDNTGAYEFLNIELQKAANTFGVSSGRYSLTANFFRTEVGSSDTYTLFLSDISDDRTEVRVTSFEPTAEILQDIYEFVTPSVPRQAAVALVEQTFGNAINNTLAPGDAITLESFSNRMTQIISNVMSRVSSAGLGNDFSILFTEMYDRVRSRTLDNIAADARNKQIQDVELLQYVVDALYVTLTEMQQSGQIDSRFEII